MQTILAYHAYKGRCNAGCVVPELLDGTKHIPWFQAGATIFDKKGIQYLGVPGLINAKSIIATLLVQVSPTCSAVMYSQAHASSHACHNGFLQRLFLCAVLPGLCTAVALCAAQGIQRLP